ncbi:unnamed protein product [Dibothriocephalus latus]|uniref:Uncharacterized protein n=1 Tax=Dibothriocephalus latus TaxID=60516 RepID=A0A3P6T729_DIBLA|nr:unnamed protein product [Dibothriocephalus latus]
MRLTFDRVTNNCIISVFYKQTSNWQSKVIRVEGKEAFDLTIRYQLNLFQSALSWLRHRERIAVLGFPVTVSTELQLREALSADIVDHTLRTPRLVLASDPNLPDNISLEVKEAARKLVDFFEERYSEKVGSLLDDALQVGTAGESPSTASEEKFQSGSLSPSSTPHSPEMMLSVARLHYRTVLHELFAQQINWGRIIAMFSFLRALCQIQIPVAVTLKVANLCTQGPKRAIINVKDLFLRGIPFSVSV